MTGKQIFFIHNNLQNFEVFYNKIKTNICFHSELLAFEDCESNYILDILKGLKPVDLVIVMAADFYNSVAEKLIKQLHSLYNIRFTNIILLYQDLKIFLNPDTDDSEPYYAFFSPEHDIDLQVAYFNQYLLTIFDKAMTQDRLNDYICNSFREVVYSELLAKKNKRINRLNEELEKKNKIDHLTHLYNREAVLEALETEIKRTRRNVWRIDHSPLGPLPAEAQETETGTILYANKPEGDIREHLAHLSILYIQIDAFGRLNDQYGYLKGDEVLLALAEVMRRPGILRSDDIVGRLGAGNFLVILPATNAARAFIPARRISAEFATRLFQDEKNNFQAGLIIGIAQYSISGGAQSLLIEQASRALKIARNQEGEKIALFSRGD